MKNKTKKYQAIKPKKKLPKYDDGGFFKKAGNWVENAAKTEANVVGSIVGGAVGNPNLIPTMTVDPKWEKANQVGTQLGGTAGKLGAQYGLQTVGVPIGVTAAGQQAIGGATGDVNNNEYNQPVDPNMSSTFIRPPGTENMKFPNGGIYPQGGEMGNAELEKKEVIQHIDGTTDQVNAPTHSQGGVDVNLEGGARIFSDRLKTKDKITFAKAAEKYKTDKFEKILSDESRDKLSKKTAELMISKHNKELDKLFAEQESLKTQQEESDLNKIMFAKGGTMISPKKAAKILHEGVANKKPLTDKQRKFMAVHAYGKPKYPNGGITNNLQDSINNIQQPVMSNGFVDKGTTMTNGSQVPVNNLRYVPTRDPRSGEITYYESPVKATPQEFANMNMQSSDANNILSPGSRKISFQEAENAYKQFPNSFSYGKLPGDLNTTKDNRFIKAYGGVMPKYPIGGTFGPYNPNYQQPNFSTTPDNNGGYGPLAGSYGKMTPDASGVNRADDQGVNWSNIAFQGANFLGQNIGNLAYLKNEGKKYDTVNYGEVTPNLVSDTSAIQDAERSYNAARVGIRDASGGNSGNYLSNLQNLQANDVMNKAKIREQFANTNAGIRNQTSMFNKGNQIQGMRDEAANKGVSTSNYYKALNGLGENIAGQSKDIRQENMDNKMLQLLRTGKYKYNPKTNSVDFIG